jgi:hypothetical protein
MISERDPSLKKLFEREKRTPAADCLVLLTDKRNLVEIDADRVEEWANVRIERPSKFLKKMTPKQLAKAKKRIEGRREWVLGSPSERCRGSRSSLLQRMCCFPCSPCCFELY